MRTTKRINIINQIIFLMEDPRASQKRTSTQAWTRLYQISETKTKNKKQKTNIYFLLATCGISYCAYVSLSSKKAEQRYAKK